MKDLTQLFNEVLNKIELSKLDNIGEYTSFELKDITDTLKESENKMFNSFYNIEFDDFKESLKHKRLKLQYIRDTTNFYILCDDMDYLYNIFDYRNFNNKDKRIKLFESFLYKEYNVNFDFDYDFKIEIDENGLFTKVEISKWGNNWNISTEDFNSLPKYIESYIEGIHNVGEAYETIKKFKNNQLTHWEQFKEGME